MNFLIFNTIFLSLMILIATITGVVGLFTVLKDDDIRDIFKFLIFTLGLFMFIVLYIAAEVSLWRLVL